MLVAVLLLEELFGFFFMCVCHSSVASAGIIGVACFGKRSHTSHGGHLSSLKMVGKAERPKEASPAFPGTARKVEPSILARKVEWPKKLACPSQERYGKLSFQFQFVLAFGKL